MLKNIFSNETIMNDKAASSQICRGCMKVGGLLLSMYGDAMDDKKLPDKLADLTSVKIDVNDVLPTVLCPKCAYRTDVFYNFKLQVQESDKKLRKMFSKFSMSNLSIDTLYNDLIDEKFVDECRTKYYGGIELYGDCIDNHLSDVLNNMNYASDGIEKSLDDNVAIERLSENNNEIIKAQNAQFLTKSLSDFNSVESESIDIAESEISNKYDDEIDSTSMDCMLLCVSSSIRGCTLNNEHIDKATYLIDENIHLKQIENKQERGLYNDTEMSTEVKFDQIVKNYVPKRMKIEIEEGKLHVSDEISLETQETIEQSFKKNESSRVEINTIEDDENSHENDINVEKIDVTNDVSDGDSDDYIDHKDNLLGSLNDTVVRIKEIKLENGVVQHQCTICMQNFSELTGILIHTVDNHIPSTGPFYCVVCEKDCDSHKELRTHVKTHVGPNPYTCFICEKGYTAKRYLKRHIACHTEFLRHRCFKCGERFKVKEDLESHIKIHAQGAAYTCSLCSRTFNNKQNYRRHLISHIDPRGVRLPNFPCYICGKRFVNNRSLQTHLRVHTGEKPFKCDICERTFTQQGNLMNHVKIHSNPRSFTCGVCGKRFNQRATLRDHTLLHTGEKPFICTVCGIAFTVGAALRRHMWKHRDEKPFGCDRCEARFIGKYDLKRHMKTHNNERRTGKIHWKLNAFINENDGNDADSNHNSDNISFPMVSINELDEPEMVLTQVTPVSDRTIFIEQVLADQNGIQMIVPQGESEKENVDALFNLIQYD